VPNHHSAHAVHSEACDFRPARFEHIHSATEQYLHTQYHTSFMAYNDVQCDAACSLLPAGFELTGPELADWIIKLQDVGNCHNINFVTPEHVAPQVMHMTRTCSMPSGR
jgi:uncharacterized Fe-S radical SAM superfamily protein PflX